MTERELSEAVRELATMFGWLAYHTYDSRRSAAGFPDWVLVRKRRLIFAELKTAKGRVSEAQQKWLDALALIGGLWAHPCEVYVWRPSDLEEIARVLR